MTTGDILVEAFKAQFITEQEGNHIWNNMLKKRRKIKLQRRHILRMKKRQ